MRALLGTVRDRLSKIVDATCDSVLFAARLSSLRSLPPRLPRIFSRQFCTKVDLTLRDCARSHFGGCRPLGVSYLRRGQADRPRSSQCRSRSRARGRRRLTRPTAISIALACVWRCYIAPLSHFSNAPRLCASVPPAIFVLVVSRSLARESQGTYN